jgi:hypothetical protein
MLSNTITTSTLTPLLIYLEFQPEHQRFWGKSIPLITLITFTMI